MRSIDSATEMPTPTDNAIIIDSLPTALSVISSTCLLSTCTAGSARTTVSPITKPSNAVAQSGNAARAEFE